MRSPNTFSVSFFLKKDKKKMVTLRYMLELRLMEITRIFLQNNGR